MLGVIAAAAVHAIIAGHECNPPQRPAGNRPLVTIQSHILQQQARYPEATGDLSWILSAISISAKMIAAQVRRARLEDVLGSAGAAERAGRDSSRSWTSSPTTSCCATSAAAQGVAVVASEENEEPVILRDRERRRDRATA